MRACACGLAARAMVETDEVPARSQDDNIKDHKAPRSVDPDEILADIDLSDDAGPAGSEGVVIIAHMVNSMESAKWGIASGSCQSRAVR